MSESAGREPQLTLDLFNTARHEFDSFLPGPNAEALLALKAWGAGTLPRVLYVWGTRGSGKTHVLQAAVQAADARGARAIYVPVAELLDAGAHILDGLDALDAIALDDVDACGGNAGWEARLFQFYNDAQAAGRRLLMASRVAPAARPFRLDDLVSRAQASLVYQLRELGEADKADALHLGARRRGLKLPDNVVEFILTRERRDMSALSAILDRLDTASLSRGRALTLPFVRDVLGSR